ncbi:MAG: RNase P subunit p30 family protein [Candidatus Nanohaloarchaea archaeon]|nr:RNase P subunit p30 family protein [Candidatus Nanohaloarchaea archaeon]
MAHTFHDLNIQSALSSGDDPPEEIAARAETLELNRIAISDYLTDHEHYEELASKIDDIETDVDIHTGVKIRADDPKELNDKISAFRDRVDVVLVHGGDVPINRAACEDGRVDILAHPEFKRKDSGIDHVLAKKAASNRVAIELNFKSVLKTYGKLRSQIMNHMQRNIRLAEKYNAPMVLCSGARRVEEMRHPRDMAGFANCMGLDLSDAFDLVEKHPRQIIQRVEEAHSDEQVRPGVEVEETSQTTLDEQGESDE